MGAVLVLFISLFGVKVSYTSRSEGQRICHSCISTRLACDERAFPKDILRSTPKSTDYCDQDNFNNREVDFTFCDAPCAFAAVWDRHAHGNYRPLGYVRGCISHFVRFSPWSGDPRHRPVEEMKCQLVSLRSLALSRKRSIVDVGERVVNLCMCNGSYCNGGSVHAGSAKNILWALVICTLCILLYWC